MMAAGWGHDDTADLDDDDVVVVFVKTASAASDQYEPGSLLRGIMRAPTNEGAEPYSWPEYKRRAPRKMRCPHRRRKRRR